MKIFSFNFRFHFSVICLPNCRFMCSSMTTRCECMCVCAMKNDWEEEMRHNLGWKRKKFRKKLFNDSILMILLMMKWWQCRKARAKKKSMSHTRTFLNPTAIIFGRQTILRRLISKIVNYRMVYLGYNFPSFRACLMSV